MSVTEITSQTPFRLTLAEPATVNGGGEVELDATAIVGAGVTPAAVAAAQSTADAAQLAATAAQADANEREVSVLVPSITTNASVFVPAPVTGTFVGFYISASAQPSATILFDSLIGGVGVDGCSVEVFSTDSAGAVKTAEPVVTAPVTAGTTSVEITWSTTNITAGTAVVVLRFVKT